MKICKILKVTLFSLILTSCGSDELTKSKAEALAKECEAKAETKAFKTVKFRYGEKEMTASDKAKSPKIIADYQKLEKLGLVKMSPIKILNGVRGKAESFEVTLTEKGKELRVGKEDNFLGSLSGNFKIYEYDFKEVKEIQEIPERNEAKVQLVFERTNETPFFDNEDETKHSKELIKTVSYRKTTDGWKLCK